MHNGKLIKCDRPRDVIQEAYWLAWKAAGDPRGAGVLQDNPGANKDEVWENVKNDGDYPGDGSFRNLDEGEYYGDYVFGRMLKLRLKEHEDGVIVPDETLRPRAHDWFGTYKSYQYLVECAIRMLRDSSTERIR